MDTVTLFHESSVFLFAFLPFKSLPAVGDLERPNSTLLEHTPDLSTSQSCWGH